MASTPKELASADPSFQETDLNFLQTKARAWLEVTLHETLPDDVQLPELLADGEILKRVAKAIRKIEQGSADEPALEPPRPAEIKAYTEPANKKAWKAYNNVDMFLQFCRTFGLKSIDMFSPPDAVEQRGLKNVYLCLRAISKLARSRSLNVVDFDGLGGTGHNRQVAVGSGIEAAKSEYLKEAEGRSSSTPPASPAPPLSELPKGAEGKGAEGNLPSSSSNGAKVQVAKEPQRRQAPDSKDAERAKTGGDGPSMIAVLAAVGAAVVGGALLLALGKRNSTPEVYEVKKGDTLIQISSRHRKGKDWHDLLEANPEIANPNVIYENEKLILKP
eukprot:jgi/Mesen1/6860/ME000351S05975